MARPDPSSSRPSWNDYFMKIAQEVATRSTCLRHHVGAVIVKDRRILATGYNGAPQGIRHCGEVGCLREERGVPSGERHELCRGLHAEQNAVIQAALHGIAVADADLYTTHQPCSLCAKILINAGIKEIFYLEPYNDELADELIREASVAVQQLDR